MKVAILGANGRIAHAVAKAFLARGHEIVAVTRSGRCDGLAGRVENRAADAMNEADLIAATQGVDVIFNGLNPPYDKWQKFALPLARNVIAAARANGAMHLFIGNIYNYGKEIPPLVSQDTPFHGSTEKARIRIEMERLFEDAAQDYGVKTIILRAGDFYGTDKKGSWFDLFIAKKVSEGIFTWPGPMNLPHAFAYLPDLADSFVSLAEQSTALLAFSSFNFNGHDLSGDQFRDILQKITGQRLRHKSVPWLAFKLLGSVHPLVREVVKMNYLWFTPHRLDATKLEAFLGEVKITPAEMAIRQALYDQKLLKDEAKAA
jgi:nucleoside-diphosphate-sugar epimerase